LTAEKMAKDFYAKVFLKVPQWRSISGNGNGGTR